MLYETGAAYIAIEQELKVLDDYIALERLRYDESLHVNFNHDIEDKKQALPPLLLMPLVENAFKHGVSETRGQPYVEMHLSVKQRQLTFTVRNSSEVFSTKESVKYRAFQFEAPTGVTLYRLRPFCSTRSISVYGYIKDKSGKPCLVLNALS
jgi:LytS/YehU family sensor histidine kinase